MWKLILTLLLLAAPAFAQERNYTITLSPGEFHYIGSLLDEEPAKRSRALMNKIETQIGQQDQAAQQGALSTFEKQVRAKIEAEEKAKAEKATPVPETRP